jgi:Fe2+ transport system protein FeoA
LTAAPHGQRLIITAIEAGYSGLRLRELGLAVGRSIEIICGRDPMICGVERARFALARRLASAIRVRLAAAYREA